MESHTAATIGPYLNSLSRRELQELAKHHRVRANGKSQDMIDSLLEVHQKTIANKLQSPSRRTSTGSLASPTSRKRTHDNNERNASSSRKTDVTIIDLEETMSSPKRRRSSVSSRQSIASTGSVKGISTTVPQTPAQTGRPSITFFDNPNYTPSVAVKAKSKRNRLSITIFDSPTCVTHLPITDRPSAGPTSTPSRPQTPSRSQTPSSAASLTQDRDASHVES